MSSSHPATDTLHTLLYNALPTRIRNIRYRPIDNNLPNPNVHILRTHINHSAASITFVPNILNGNAIILRQSLHRTHQNVPNTDSNQQIRIISLMQVNITPNTKDFRRKVLQFPENFIPLQTQSRNAQIINIAEWSSW